MKNFLAALSSCLATLLALQVGVILCVADHPSPSSSEAVRPAEIEEGVDLSLSNQAVSSTFHVIEDVPTDCVKISMEEGVFHYKSRGGGGTCGLYLVTDPDKSIIITVDYLDVLCHQGGLISVVDGWELNGQVFPSVEDHEKSLETRFHDLCVDPRRRHRLRKTFSSSQNAALIQYRIPSVGQGFSVRVQHVPNPRPCNILVQDLEAVYTLQNYGRNVNCSLTTLFDAKVRLVYMSTGLQGSKVKFHTYRGIQSGIYHKCGKMGLQDYVQIGGSSGLDTSRMHVIEEMCGYESQPRSKPTTIFCGMTTLRLVSSGRFQNKVAAEVRKADIEDIASANFFCDL